MKSKFIRVVSILFIIPIITITLLIINRKNDKKIPELIIRSGDSQSSSEFLNAQKAVEFYRHEIEKHPEIVKNYIELAQLFLQEARITGKYHEYIPSAERLIDEALERYPENPDALITKASIKMIIHQFTEAKQLAERAIKQNSFNAFSYGVLCDAFNELGEYKKAVTACDKMLSIRPDLRSYSRASYLREIYGEAEASINAMRLAANAGVFGQENRAWALYNLGNLFLNIGKVDTAEFIYKGILEERPGYGYAYNGLAKVSTFRNDYSSAINYLLKSIKLTDEHEFLEHLADIYKVLGQKNKEEEYIKKSFAEFEEHNSAGWNINREYAMFCANHNINLDEALKRIMQEYEIRPNNIDVLDTYAWVLNKNKRPEEAVPYMEKALRLHTYNPTYFYHAAVIYNNAGMEEKSRLFVKKIKANNSFINVLYASDLSRLISSFDVMASKK